MFYILIYAKTPCCITSRPLRILTCKAWLWNTVTKSWFEVFIKRQYQAVSAKPEQRNDKIHNDNLKLTLSLSSKNVFESITNLRRSVSHGGQVSSNIFSVPTICWLKTLRQKHYIQTECT